MFEQKVLNMSSEATPEQTDVDPVDPPGNGIHWSKNMKIAAIASMSLVGVSLILVILAFVGVFNTTATIVIVTPTATPSRTPTTTTTTNLV
jgi:hypothetical protein